MENDSINENSFEEEKIELKLNPVQNKKNLIILIMVMMLLATGTIITASKYIKPANPIQIQTVEGCRSGDKYSQTTGELCQGEMPDPCQEGELYNRDTGKPCVK